MGSFINIPTPDGRHFQAWLAEPSAPAAAGQVAAAALPGIVLLAEAFNVNQWARANAQRYADQGYRVLVPDLYWRQEPGVYLPYTPESQKRGRALYAKLDFDAAVEDTATCIGFLRGLADSNGRVGLLGYCLGGKIAFLAGSRADPDAVAGYYSIDLEASVDEVPQVQCDTVLHFGEQDERVPIAIAGALNARKAPDQPFEVLAYPAPHGFGRFGQPCFRNEAAVLAEQRTLQLFEAALGNGRGAPSTPVAFPQ